MYYSSGQILEGTGSYCISNIDDFEALAQLESQPDIINKVTSLDLHTPRTETQNEKASTGYANIAEFIEWYGHIAEFTE